MSVDTQWEQHVFDIGDLIAHFRLNETSTSFSDVVNDYIVTVTSGVTMGQPPGLVGNPIDKSATGSATVVTGQTAAITELTSTDIRGPFNMTWMIKITTAPTAIRRFLCLGDEAFTRSNLTMAVDATDLRIGQELTNLPPIVAHTTTNLTDGNWHTLSINYDILNTPITTARMAWSVDGGAFADGGENILLDHTPAIRGMWLFRNASMTASTGIHLDEVMLYDKQLSDADIASIHDKALVTGLHSGIGNSRNSLRLGLGL